LRQCLENALAAELLPLERDIVRLRHGLDDGKSRTVKEVMESSGGMLSIGDIRNLESRAYKKLRFKHSVHTARLREFAEEFIGVSPEMLETVS
jgi:DNA-directed RNA polymerase sigma subunit (sigma70/sigma32)